MQIKKFKSETFEAALKDVKRELGPNAIILSKKTVKDPGKGVFGLMGKSLVELTAAIDKRGQGGEKPVPQTPMGRPPSGGLADLASKVGGDLVSLSQNAQQIGVKRKKPRVLAKKYIEIDDEDTIDDLILNARKKKIKEAQENKNNDEYSFFGKKNHKEEPERRIESKNELGAMENTPKAMKKLCLNLTLSGIDTKYIKGLVNSITENMNPLLIKKDNYLESFAAKYLMDNMKFSGEIKLYNTGPKLVVVMGATGVGKTTTLAKIASTYQNRGMKVGVITLDVHKIGAIEQLKVFSNILGFPLKVASKTEDFVSSVSELKDYDLILIDTAGRGKNDGEDLSEVKKILNINMPIEKHLCLSACMRESDALVSVKRFSSLGIDRIIFTKLDDTSVHGSIYNIMQKTNMQVSYFTIGQRVPDDMELGTSERLVDLIMKLSSN